MKKTLLMAFVFSWLCFANETKGKEVATPVSTQMSPNTNVEIIDEYISTKEGSTVRKNINQNQEAVITKGKEVAIPLEYNSQLEGKEVAIPLEKKASNKPNPSLINPVMLDQVSEDKENFNYINDENNQEKIDYYNSLSQKPALDQEKIDYYNQLHEEHAANFNGPTLWGEIEVAPHNGSRDGSVSVEICSLDSWSYETYWILLDTTNWWAWGADGWTQHTSGANVCQDWSTSVPAGNYMFILADTYGDGGATADISVNGELVGTVATASGDAFSSYSYLYEAPFTFDVTDAEAAADAVVTFDLDGLDDCGFVSVTGTFDDWSGWGANNDTGMAASIPAGDHEFVILCTNTEGEWWNDIWANSTVINAPIDGSCWNGNYDYANYTLSVGADDMTVAYCAGTCDAECAAESTCTDYTYSYDGSWGSEVSFTVGDQSGTGAGGSICLDDGTYTVTMYDSYGDGWNSGGTVTLYDADGNAVASFGLASGGEGTAEICLGADCAAPVLGCTDDLAENYNADADTDDGTCTYNGGCSSSSQCACDDGECKPCSYFCDGSSEFGNAGWGADCSDGSDEGEHCCAEGGDYSGTDCSDLYGCDDVWMSGAVEDCAGTCGGSAVADDCGVCDGDGSSCACSGYTLVVGGGSWGSEVSWDLSDGSSGSVGTFDLCLEDGDYTFNGYDSYGDGWNGNTATFTDADGNVIATFAVEGSSGSWTLTVPGAPLAEGCTDPNAPNYDADALVDDGSCEEYCGGTDCGYWLGMGYTCDELLGYGYDCSVCDASGDCAAPFVCQDGSEAETPEGCESCAYDWSDYGAASCDAAWDAFGLDCATLEANYGWNCLGCACPGDNTDTCDEGYDCAGECGGSAVEDCSGACGGDAFTDCSGACVAGSYASWNGDGYCDDGAWGVDLHCPDFGCDSGDCGTELLDDGTCGTAVDLGAACAEAGGHFCGDDDSNWTSYSPNGCVPDYYICDGWDDCVDGSDESDCSAAVEFSVDMNFVDQPSADYDNVVINGSWNGWAGWGVQLFDEDGDGVFTGAGEFDPGSTFEYVVAVTGAADGWSGWGMQWGQCDGTNFVATAGDAGSVTSSSAAPGDCPAESYTVTFDLDGLSDCGFVSVTGTFDGWSGWGAHTDSGMSVELVDGDYEFVILCVDTSIDQWWNDIWSASTQYTAPLGSDCDFINDDEYPNYGFTVAGGDLSVAYCAGSCDATCPTCTNYDCVGTCADGYESWATDSYCDDGAWGIDFTCPEWGCDDGACGEVLLDDGTCGTACATFDCVGTCAEGYESWATDSYCDDGAWGIDFTCPEWGCDDGACGTVLLDDGTCGIPCSHDGDANGDGSLNVSDVVTIIDGILDGSGGDTCSSDVNGDGVVNVTDVVIVVQTILGGSARSDIHDANSVDIIVTNDSIELEANGYVGGVQMTLSHGTDFSIDLVDAFVAEYKTINNVTTLIVVSDNQSLEQIATINGKFKVESAIVVNSGQQINDQSIIELKGVELEMAGPNPFNPSTSLNVVVPDAGHVTVKIYNVVGQHVATLADGYMERSASGYTLNWNASQMPSGVYLVRAETAGSVSTQKLMLLK